MRLRSRHRVLEDSLDLRLAEVLAIMQDRFLGQTTYFGVPAVKNPLDFWIYQEIICETKPDVVVEIGNHCGGSTLALAHLCDCRGSGRVIGVDLSHAPVHQIVREHPRIELIEGDACASFPDVQSLIRAGEQVMVIEDSEHTYENTLNVMRTYGVLVKPGGYMVVEDGICYHGLETGPRPGPYEAVETFVKENPAFEIDRDRESFLVTWNPKGFLKRLGS